MLNIRVKLARIEEKVGALDRLMQAKYVNLETMMKYQAEKVALALSASQLAIDKQDISDEKARDRLAEDTKFKFASVNELRGALEDSQRQNLTRTEFEVYRKATENAIAQMRTNHSEQLSDLKERLDKAEGRSGGISNVWGVIVAVAGIVIAIGALIFRNINSS